MTRSTNTRAIASWPPIQSFYVRRDIRVLAVSTGSCSGPVGKDFAGAPSALLVWCGGADSERPGPLSVPGAASAFQGRQLRATPGSCRPTK